MASPFAADVGKAARAVPRAAIALPRAAASLPRAALAVPSKRQRRRLAVAVALLIALIAVYFLWFRNSSLVAVDEVEVSGLSFAEEEIAAALTEAGKEMTTLNPDARALERAVEGYPTVASVSIDPDFPCRLAVTVTERVPVATVGADGGVPVSGDGTVLAGVDPGGLDLPALEVENAPAAGRLDGIALTQAEVLGAAPVPLRPAIRATEVSKDHGVVTELAEGIEVRFGDSADAAAKWAAVVAILADPKLDQLAYIDVRIPGRPAVGGARLPEPTTEEAAEAAAAAVAPPAIDAAATDPAAAPVDPAAAVTDPAAVAPPPDPAPAADATSPAPTAPAAVPATGVAGGAAAP